MTNSTSMVHQSRGSIDLQGSNLLPHHLARAVRSPGRQLDGALERSLARIVPSTVRQAPQRVAGSELVSHPQASHEVEAGRIAQQKGREGVTPTAWDFSGVRVHTGSEARASARALGAAAYTIGEHVVYGSDAFPPRGHHDEGLLLHELVHVAQHRRAGSPEPHLINRQGDREEADRRRRGPSGSSPTPVPATTPGSGTSPSAEEMNWESLRERIHRSALEALRDPKGVTRLRPHIPTAPPALRLNPRIVVLPGPPRPSFALPPELLRPWPGDVEGDATTSTSAHEPQAPPAPSGPPALQSPSPMFSSWTNAAPVLPYGHLGLEYNQAFQGGSGGLGLMSQGSARLGLARNWELGAVGNLGISDTGPTTGALGITAHYGPTALEPGRFRGGFLGIATAGSGQGPGGGPVPVVNVTLVPLVSRRYLGPSGGDSDQRQWDINPGVATYSSVGSFGPGPAAPHLLLAPAQTQFTLPLDPHNSLSFEGLLGPGAALGTMREPKPLFGVRGGVGLGFQNTSGSGNALGAFGVNLNAYTDITTRGTSYAVFTTLTWVLRPTNSRCPASS